MNYSLYGFVEIQNFRNNTPGHVATVGEFPKESWTYSKENETYSLATYRNVRFIALDSKRKDVLVPVNLAYQDTVLKISEWLYGRSISSNIPSDKAALLQALRAEFGDTTTIKEVGDIVRKDTYLFPTFISFSATNAGEENNVYVWYSAQKLFEQYPNSEHDVVLPVDNIDDLVGNRDKALSLLKAITIVSNNARVNKIAAANPQTYLMTMNFDWHDIDNPDIKYPAPFNDLIHGPAGKNIDYIKEAFRNAILTQSQHGVDVWSKHFPDLFTKTEFYVVPLWDRVALPNKEQSIGTYSSTVPVKDISVYAAKYFKGYDAAHIAENVCVSSAAFQCLQFISCGNKDNYGAQTSFDKQWPTYCDLDTRAPDFGQIPPEMQQFIIILNTLFKAAEEATETTLLPNEMTRAERDGVYYLTSTVGNIQLLCPIKKGFSKV